MKFKVGDHVIGNKKNCYGITREGWRGVVTKVVSDRTIEVSADPSKPLYNSTFSVNADCFDLVKRPGGSKIVVTTDGTTTTARLYEGKSVIKSAEAKCSANDEFDFKTGAALAVDRLLGRKTEEPVTPDAIPFNRAFLTTGRFGRTNRNVWFVVVGDHLVYLRGSDGWDDIDSFGENGITRFNHSIDFVVEANGLRNAMQAARTGSFIWSRT